MKQFLSSIMRKMPQLPFHLSGSLPLKGIARFSAEADITAAVLTANRKEKRKNNRGKWKFPYGVSF